MLFVNKIEGEPGDSKIQRVRATKRTCCSGPKWTLPQNINHTGRSSGVMSVRLTTWHPPHPSRQPCQAYQTDPKEYRLPSVICHQKAGTKRSRRRAEFHSSDDRAIGEPAIMFRQMVREDLRITRK